jgi:DNA repair exonuclease SbcCD nuclease subunit
MPLARFLQIADVHLGRAFGWLPAARREERRRDQRFALEKAVVAASERGVNAILIPGDLFDQEGVDVNTLSFALDAFDKPGCPPVFIAPGNHDPYSGSSHYYHEGLLRARGYHWPKHVHVFTTPDWQPAAVPNLDGVRVWGRCYAAGGTTDQRPLSKAALEGVSRAAPVSGFDLGVVHASRENFLPPGQKLVAPFSDTELQDSPFAYVALGHYHARSEMPAAGSRSRGVRAAYSGSTVALDMTETAAHGALEIKVEYGRESPNVSVEPIELDRRRVHDVTVDLTGSPHSEAMDRRVLRAFEEQRVGEGDLVILHLTGRLPVGVRYEPGPDVAQRTFHFKLERSDLRPGHDIRAYRGEQPPNTTEERFARALIAKLDQEKDPRRRAVIESAFYYGLDALKLRSVVPSYEELSGS